MAGETFTTSTVEASGSVENDELQPDCEVHILVGGPYTRGGEEFRYGHTALRVICDGEDQTYDFGRYGEVSGVFGESGEGILRVWSSFSRYISGENVLGRTTWSFEYSIFRHQADAVLEHFRGLRDRARHRPELERGRSFVKVYQLATDYHATSFNCTTISLDGMKVALPDFEDESATFIRPGDVLTRMERVALRASGTPGRIFLPDNLRRFLESDVAMAPDRVQQFGGR